VIKVFVSAGMIALVSWLAKKNTPLAGFLTALPMTTILALAFTHQQWRDPALSVEYAKSIFFAVPATMTFFIPFLLAQRLNLGFWSCFFSGLFLLLISYLVQVNLLAGK
jgi:uncharacterized membrane protein (GlpM family)